ncbi:terminase small subunit [Serratia proteamaculans]|uniref:terminase small subunit n=1 Tax=Serratia proteamaculans TaxID=28151 RepID=UPI0014797A4E|nr:terminase small subunit [Serratia proteamaculans]
MISLRELARQYSYDEATVRQWKLKGMPHGKDIPDEITRNWIVENIIKPLRDTNTREQIEKEKLRDITASANIKELDEAERKGELINVAIVESELAKYFHQFKTIMRSIPSSEYLKLFESKDAITLKHTFQEVIDNALREIGSLELGNEEVQEDLQENDKKDTTSRKDTTE